AYTLTYHHTNHLRHLTSPSNLAINGMGNPPSQISKRSHRTTARKNPRSPSNDLTCHPAVNQIPHSIVIHLISAEDISMGSVHMKPTLLSQLVPLLENGPMTILRVILLRCALR